MSKYLSQKVTTFHGKATPEPGFLAGYAFLTTIIEENGVNVPLPARLAIFTEKHQRNNTKHWQVFRIRYKPDNTITGHLAFALKYEGIDLYILKKLFKHKGNKPVLHMIKKEPISHIAGEYGSSMNG